ncbi:MULTISPECIES: beta-ketoacyl synthase N-terminal-like domain-containing protein [Burkholderia]|uniref:TstN n=3 Tax=pseudomallei group TaxID=111527 RepID=R9S7P4_BURTH|nr:MULTISPECIES: beta-ketoacyl synthase N-terminal-like domain-containing protein [Burkholderia]AGN11888.1 TstN [Burkholderia humptydooensis]AJY40522.1 polyketide biosynthesis malonyl-ACP decarboxylase PksF [Burkholderia sp. 2002721687]ALX45148.1 polyketide beta-ketoacyl:ACP synthase [Burkholderia humptydooensis]EIP85587.1 Putative beta-ketoacyl synthase [Burkholderia humptydooensis MSMB43]KVN11369.1 polyketide beta-ketoacyl:ACP synthase [Burkholderia sp. MSMB1552]
MRTPDAPVVSGIGVVSAIGQGRAAFLDALLEGRHRFDAMRRRGRQWQPHGETPATAFPGAEIDALAIPESMPRGMLRTASLSAQAALVTLDEAWRDARLDDVAPERIGLVIGGSNVQQRELALLHDAYRDRIAFLRPTYAMSFMDTDLCGICTEAFGIRGFAQTVGSASASGQMAVLQAIEAVGSGRVDACIAIGALMDLSYWECQGFSSLGAMAAGPCATQPALACRPFDADRNGFVYGEACAALVIERDGSRPRDGVEPYARIAGWSVALDGNRNPDPSLEGEAAAIRGALSCAGLDASDIDYVNPHGTGSVLGDVIELQALRACGLDHAWLNATKSIVGHGLTAAGAVELAAVLLQMRAGRLHPTRNLDNPIDPGFRWVRQEPVAHTIRHALNLSIGFGGVNTAVCVSRHDAGADVFQE